MNRSAIPIITTFKGALPGNDIVATSGPETAKLFSAEGITVKIFIATFSCLNKEIPKVEPASVLLTSTTTGVFPRYSLVSMFLLMPLPGQYRYGMDMLKLSDKNIIK